WPHRWGWCSAASYSPTWSSRSTIGAGELSFRVRNGAGRFLSAVAAVTLGRYGVCGCVPVRPGGGVAGRGFPTVSREPHGGRESVGCGQVLGLLVPVGFTCCHASTSGLSTQSS